MNLLDQMLRTYELTNAQVVLLADQANPGGQSIARGTVGSIFPGPGSLGEQLLRPEPVSPQNMDLPRVRVQFVSESGSGTVLAVPVKDLLLTHRQHLSASTEQLRKLQTLSSMQGAVHIDFQNNLIGLHQECIRSLGYTNAHRVQFLISQYGKLLFLAITDNAKPGSNTTVVPGFLSKMLLTHQSNSSLSENQRRYIIEDQETVRTLSNYFPSGLTKVALDLIPGINTKRLTYENEPVTAFFIQERISIGDRTFGSAASKVRSNIEHYFSQVGLPTINSRPAAEVADELYQRILNIQ